MNFVLQFVVVLFLNWVSKMQGESMIYAVKTRD